MRPEDQERLYGRTRHLHADVTDPGRKVTRDAYCVSCGSQNVRIMKAIKSKRPNGSFMEEHRCRDCKTTWDE